MTKWPKCRDASLSGCEVSSENPVLPSDDLIVDPFEVTVDFESSISVRCKMPSNATEGQLSPITDAFTKLDLVRLQKMF